MAESLAVTSRRGLLPGKASPSCEGVTYNAPCCHAEQLIDTCCREMGEIGVPFISHIMFIARNWIPIAKQTPCSLLNPDMWFKAAKTLVTNPKYFVQGMEDLSVYLPLLFFFLASMSQKSQQPSHRTLFIFYFFK